MVTKNLPLERTANLLPSQRDQIFDAFRRWGHLQAKLDPLEQYLVPEPIPEIQFDGEDADAARSYYCGSIGVEFMHLPEARREWIQERMEQPMSMPDQRHVLERLTQADLFEQVIQSRYLGTKRFSLEGVTVLIPFLDEVLNRAAELGAEKSVMGMSHRGRLNVMANTFGKSAADIFSKFEDANPRSILGGGDVKYHVGATGQFLARTGVTMGLHLVSNPSHLEAVDPVAMGRSRAQQMRIGETGQTKVLPVLIHGDAAFAGQGIWAETMSLGTIPGFTVGGTIQIIVNNLIGFTADPDECYSSRFSSDIGKRLPIPIFHVTQKMPMQRCASRRWLSNIAIHSTPMSSSTSSVTAATGTARWTTRPSPNRCATPKSRIIFRSTRSTPSKSLWTPPSRVKELQGQLAEAQKQAAQMKKSARWQSSLAIGRTIRADPISRNTRSTPG